MEETLGDEEALKRFILSEIRKRGPVPFFQYMDWCLYHPEYGYYQTGKAKIGKEGDYYTAPSVHPLFGGIIAKQLLQMVEILKGDLFQVIEVGAGKGTLCRDILNWMREKSPSLYPRLRYHLIETSASAVAEQRERLAGEEREGIVSWLPPEAIGGRSDWIEGCVLSNELMDAFPVHRVVLHEGRLKEGYVAERGGEFVEEWGELTTPRIESYFDSIGISLGEGQTAEVNLKAVALLGDIGRSLRRGFVMTIDYGYAAEELYAPHRTEGTLLGYFRNRTSTDLLERPGNQDLTSHVDFSSLIRSGEDAGLHLTGIVPQYRFLIAMGLLDEMDSRGREMSDFEALRMRLSIKHLLDPEAGMGESFKVLIQHKGIEKPDLDGLRDLDETIDDRLVIGSQQG